MEAFHNLPFPSGNIGTRPDWGEPGVHERSAPLNLTIFYWLDPWSDATGGIEQYIRSFIRYAGAGTRIELVGVTTDPRERPPDRWLEIPFAGNIVRFYALFTVSDLDRQRRMPLSATYMLKLRSKRPAYRGDLLIVHRPEPILVLSRHKPIVFVNHMGVHDVGAQKSDFRWSRLPWLYGCVEARAVAAAERVICVREQACCCMRERYPDRVDDVVFRPTWFDPDVFFAPDADDRAAARAMLRNSLGLPSDARIVITVGRLDHTKNHHQMIETMHRLSESDRHIVWLFVGGGTLSARLEARINSLGLTDRIRLFGRRCPREVAELLRGSDLFVLASRHEGMSIALLEAQACGLPVVVSDVGEVRRTVADKVNGMIVPEPSPETLAAAICESLRYFVDFATDLAAGAVIPFAADQQVPVAAAEFRSLAKVSGSGALIS